jgi:hypothetical protein
MNYAKFATSRTLGVGGFLKVISLLEGFGSTNVSELTTYFCVVLQYQITFASLGKSGVARGKATAGFGNFDIYGNEFLKKKIQ